MRTGLFCTYKIPESDFSVAYAQQTELVKLIEDLGFERRPGIAEHHLIPMRQAPRR